MERRRRQDAAAAEELRGVAAFADANRVDESDPMIVRAIDPDMAHLYDGPLLGREGELRLAGQDAFAVCEFAVCELAAALGMSEPAARAYGGQAVELRDRLPRFWSQVMGGMVPAWRARQVATETIPLSADAAAYVDAQLAPFAAKLSLTRVLRAVEAAVQRHDPELARERGQKAAEKRAVGVLADPQYALDLQATAELAADGSVPARRPRRSRGKGDRPVVQLHPHTDAIQGLTGATGPDVGHVARVPRLGPRALAVVEQWLADLTPGATVTVTPVVDLTQ